MKWIRTNIYSIPAVIWMGLIFYLSHQPAEQSSELSSSFSEILMNMIVIILPIQVEMNMIHFLIRKAAHFFAYFMLGLFVFHALKKSVTNIRKSSGWTIIICVLYAVSDEIHQWFIPGRSCELRDVLIDSSGVLSGLILYILLNRIVRNKRKKVMRRD